MNETTKEKDKLDINLTDFLWHITIRRLSSIDEAYREIMENELFLKNIRKNPENISENALKETLIKFLNKWSCRIKVKDFDYDELKNTLIKSKNLFLLDENIENINLDKNSDNIQELYGNFESLKDIGGTTASKVLHVINPDLFPPWDKEIANSLEFSRNKDGYTGFLKRVEKDIDTLNKEFLKVQENISSSKNDFKDVDIKKTLIEGFELPEYYSYPKFMDEFYHSKHTKGLKIDMLKGMFSNITEKVVESNLN